MIPLAGQVFSEHAIDASMKEEAIEAVSQLRDELTAALVEATA